MIEGVIECQASRAELLETASNYLSGTNQSQSLSSLILVKVNRLKDIQLEVGYERAEGLLEQLAGRIASALRADDTFARIESDEFGLLLTNLRSAGQPLMAIAKLRRGCEEPLYIDGKEFYLSLRFGGAMAPVDAGSAESLMRCADLSLRGAQEKNVDALMFSDLDELPLQPLMRMESLLTIAIQDGNLDSTYEPIVGLQGGEIQSAALVPLWNTDIFGSVGRSMISSLAERQGKGLEYATWALNNSLRECREWQSAIPDMTVAVPLMQQAIVHPHIAEIVQRSFRLWDVQPEQLVIEITEDALTKDPESCMDMLHKLHAQGLKIAIEDFGSRNSSLAFLKNLPIDVVKVGSSFVSNMLQRPADRAIVQTIIDLAHNLDLDVIAEGVMDEETLDSLTLMGCTSAQGDAISGGMPASELPGWLSNSEWEQAAAD